MEKIALLFPGQGSHFVGMGQSFYEQYPVAKHTFEEASDTLGVNLAKICFEGSVGELSRAVNAHPALVTVSVALFRVYMREVGFLPHFCAGHSLGEYSALTCAGAIRFADVLRIVRFRAQVTEDLGGAGGGAMSVIEGLPPHAVQAECERVATEGQFAAVACYNSPRQVLIAGDADAVMQVEDRVLEMGGQGTPLFGSAPFHCKLMEGAAQQVKAELQRYTLGYLRYPVLANVNAAPYQGPEHLPENLYLHMVRPVQWQSIMDYLKKRGVTLVIEMGAKNVLCNLVHEQHPGMRALCFGVKEDRTALPAAIGARRDPPTLITRCMASGVAAPNRNPSAAALPDGVVKPYRQMLALQDRIEREKRAPTVAEMKEALEALRLMLQTKQLSPGEQTAVLDQLLDQTGTHDLFGGRF